MYLALAEHKTTRHIPNENISAQYIAARHR